MESDEKYTAVIIDDEEKLREVIKLKVARYCPRIEVIGQAGDAESGARLVKESSPQIIFLDIAMPKGTGLDMLASLGEINSEVIFITGYNQYALQALKLSAVDYLLKPIVDEELIAAVTKAKKRINEQALVSDYRLLMHNMEHHKGQDAKLSIPGVSSYDQLTISEIVRCEGEQRYTRIFLSSRKSLISSYNIGVFKEILLPYEFATIHKSHLVNTRHIDRYLKEGVVVMSDGSSAPVSRRRREEFKERIIQIVAAGGAIDTDH